MIKLIKRKISNLLSDRKFSEILTGSAWALSARVSAAGFAMVTTIVTARFYGADIVGVVAVIHSFLVLVTIFTVLGTNTSILRLVPEHLARHSATSAHRLYRRTQWCVAGISILTGVLVLAGSRVIAASIFSKPHLSFYFSLAAGFIIFKSLMLLNTQAVRGLRLIKHFAFMLALPSLSNLIFLALLTFFFYTRENPVYAYLAGVAVTAVTGWVIIEYAFRRRMQPHDPVKEMRIRDILNISLPMLMTATMYFVIGQTGVIMLGMFSTEAEVGHYSVAVRLATLTGFILQAVNSMAAPKFSNLFHRGEMDELFHVAKKSTKLIFWTTAPILLVLVILGKLILWLLFGEEFTVAYYALVLLSIGQFVNSVSGSTGMFMNMTGHQKTLSKIMVGAAVINILLNITLIPALGINGAAMAGMVSFSFWNICALIFIKRTYGRSTGYLPITIGS